MRYRDMTKGALKDHGVNSKDREVKQSRGNQGKTGYSGNMGNRYMQRIVLPQSVFSLQTSVMGSADYYTNQLLCNSLRELKQSLVILSFDLLLNCLFDDPSKFAK